MNIFVTSCNSVFFKSCKTLISSCYKFFNNVDKIVIYDLGLTKEDRIYLSSLRKVYVVDYDKDFLDKYPHFSDPRTYAWKTYVLYDITRERGNICVYLDAGACFVGSVDPVIDIVKKDDVLIVGDSHYNYSFTHDECFKITNATEAERNGKHIWAGFQAYASQGRYQSIIDEAFEYAKIKDCIATTERNKHQPHRQDQSLYSILSIRHNAPRSDLSIFGEYRSKKSRSDQIVYAHRNTYFNEDNL